jgi:hypothetical protein
MPALGGVLRISGGIADLKHRRREIVKDNRIKWASRGIGFIFLCLGLLLSLLSVSMLFSGIVAIGSYLITDYLSPFLLQKLFKPKQ